MKPPRVLHVLSQRPSLTGSGITLDALVRHAAEAGWDQTVVAGVPASDPAPAVGELPEDRVLTVTFGDGGDLPFPVPGMSDVMPYESTVWSTLGPDAIEAYRTTWRARLAEVVARVRPDVIHGHHAWIVGGLLPEVADGVPVFLHTHGTALRQLELCPHLADDVVRAVGRVSGMCVLHDLHRERYAARYGIDPDRVRVVGAGYREDLFHAEGRASAGDVVAYAGKLSDAKGLHPLLDAVSTLAARRPGLVLHVAGDGSGPEADAIRARLAALGDRVVVHGRLDQAGLAEVFRRASVFVLPSYYEGLPLVLVEALACGARLVSSALPGVVDGLADPLGDALSLVPLPTLVGVDRPDPAEVPAYAERLAAALDAACDRGPVADDPERLASFTWRAVFQRVVSVWRP